MGDDEDDGEGGGGGDGEDEDGGEAADDPPSTLDGVVPQIPLGCEHHGEIGVEVWMLR